MKKKISLNYLNSSRNYDNPINPITKNEYFLFVFLQLFYLQYFSSANGFWNSQGTIPNLNKYNSMLVKSKMGNHPCESKKSKSEEIK